MKAHLDRLKNGEVITSEDITGLLSISLSLDSTGNVLANAHKKQEDIPVDSAGITVKETFNNVNTQEKEKIEVESEVEVSNTNKYLNLVKKINIGGVLLYIVIGIVLFIIITFIIKRRK